MHGQPGKIVEYQGQTEPLGKLIPSVRAINTLPARINVDSMFGSDSSVLKQTKQWRCDGRFKVKKKQQSSKRSLHERNGVSMDGILWL